MMLASNWLSALKLSIRGRAGSGAKRSGRQGRRTRDDRRVAAERLEPRCLLTSYNFVKIAEASAEVGATYLQLGDQPAINASGEVAFRAIDAGAGTFNVVAKGSGGAITRIEDHTGPYYQFGEPSINASGQVAFLGFNDNPGEQGILIGNGVGPATTVVSATAAAVTGEFEQLDRLPDINDDGDIAFIGDKPETTGIFHRSAAGVVTTLAQESDGYQTFAVFASFVSLNNSDGVSFNATLTGGDSVIAHHTGPGGVRTNLRDASGAISAFSRTAISQDGDVLTSVILDTGAQELTRYSNAGAVENVQVFAAATDFLQFEFPNLIDNDGGMVFRGVLDSGMTGIYTGTAAGSDPVANKVIDYGDTLDGKVISSIVMSSNAANSAGQIAFFVSFPDGSMAIYRADPLPPPQELDWGDLPESATTTLPASYKTTAVNGGPSHVIDPELTIGDTVAVGPEVDAESDGQPTPLADGDNTNGVNDENNVVFTVLSQSLNFLGAFPTQDINDYTITVSFEVSTAATNLTGGPATLYSFMDLTRDGDFTDSGERLTQGVPDGSDEAPFANTFTRTYNLGSDLHLPNEVGFEGLNLPLTFAIRHRLSTDADLLADGPATNGEVEDSLVSLTIATDAFFPRTVTVTGLTIPSFIDAGAAVTLTATVTPETPNSPMPTGDVEFFVSRETSFVVVGVDAGSDPTVTLRDLDGQTTFSFNAYPTSFQGGVRVALGDVTGDGVAEIITAPGPGGDTVKIFSVSSGGDDESQFSFMDFHHITVSDPMLGTRGWQIASGDLNGDGFADIVVSGGPKVIVFSGLDFSELHNLTPFGTSASEIRVAVGDVNGDGMPELVTGSGPSTIPNWIRVFNPLNGNVLTTFAPFEPTFRGGVNLAVGDINGDGIAEIIAAKGPGSTPQVKVFDGNGKFHSSFMAYSVASREGVRVATGDLDGDGIHELIVDPAAVRGAGTTQVYTHSDGKFGPDPAFDLSNIGTGYFAAGRTQTEFVFGTAPLDDDGVATLITDDLGPGFKSIAARYLGSPVYQFSTSTNEHVLVRALRDYGDAPFQSGQADNGARHRPAITGPILGTSRDAEYDGLYEAQDGDDSTGIDDEDGVTFLSPVLNRTENMALMSSVIVHASADGFLDAFIDFNRNGRFDDSERINPPSGLTTQTNFSIPVVAGDNVISFQVPALDVASAAALFGFNDGLSRTYGTYARFRISSTGNLTATGEATDGEVEDYPIDIRYLGSNGSEETGSPIAIQLPAFAANGGSGLASFDIFVDGGLLTLALAGQSSGGDRSPLFQMPFDGRQRLEIMGTAGDDLLRLDLSGSNVSMQDFHFDGGGEATAAGDSIEIIGGSRRFNEISLQYDDLEDGVISLDSTRIEFVDLEPIVLQADSEDATLRFRSESFANAVATLQRAGENNLSFSGSANFAGSPQRVFESVTLRAPRNSLQIELTTGDDVLEILSLPASMTNTSIRIDALNGNDSVNASAVINSLQVLGGFGSDTIITGFGDDLIFGSDGGDQISAGHGANTVYGGEGNDFLSGGLNADILLGEAGDDRVFAGAGADFVDGGSGLDSLYGELGDDVLNGQAGSDFLEGNSGNDSLDGGDDNDILVGSEGDDSLTGGLGDDNLRGESGADSIQGGAGADFLLGGTGADQLDGGNGADSISGEDGNDTVFGGEDADSLDGGSGTDQITGGGGNDMAFGGDGEDRISGDVGSDFLEGGEGRDVIEGGLDHDTLTGGEDNDTINGGQGNDLLAGDEDNDSLNGGDGDDTVLGGDDDDNVLGGNGNDSVSGDDGDDRVLGQAGNDTVSAGEGVDYLDGGTGSDAISEFTLNATITPTRLTLVNLDGDTENETLRGIERALLNAAFAPAGVMLNASAFRGSVTLIGSAFNDTITGGLAADSISGGFGNDSIVGGNGNDTILGNDGLDTIKGGDGNDSIKGGEGNDSLLGEKGNDTLNGGAGNDTLDGGDGDDGLSGFTGDDSMLGGIGNDTMIGGNGKDTMLGGAGNDICLGKELADSIKGEAGADTLAGGSGAGPDAGDVVTRDAADLAAALAEAFVFNAAWIDEI